MPIKQPGCSTIFLTNAIKYSYLNTTIEVLAKQEDGHVTFSVKDHAQGIGKEYLPRLFERYFQVPGSKEKGNGLGLAISKEFIEAQKALYPQKAKSAKAQPLVFNCRLNDLPARCFAF